MNVPESYCLGHTQFKFKNQRSFYQGKVRDRYDLDVKTEPNTKLLPSQNLKNKK